MTFLIRWYVSVWLKTWLNSIQGFWDESIKWQFKQFHFIYKVQWKSPVPTCLQVMTPTHDAPGSTTVCQHAAPAPTTELTHNPWPPVRILKTHHDWNYKRCTQVHYCLQTCRWIVARPVCRMTKHCNAYIANVVDSACGGENKLTTDACDFLKLCALTHN